MIFWNTAQVQAAAVMSKLDFAKLIQIPLGKQKNHCIPIKKNVFIVG